jgi:hypothetical protein
MRTIVMAKKAAKKMKAAEPLALSTAVDTIFVNPPRKHVFLLSCMDQRLLDNIVHFMNKLNLQNRYDHLTFAGAAMGALHGESPWKTPGAVKWKEVFFDHLTTAINSLKREIRDIILLEHLDCGAYKVLHSKADVKEQYDAETDVRKLVHFHSKEAWAFKQLVDQYCLDMVTHAKTPEFARENWKKMRVHCLYMDLVGEVDLLPPPGGVDGL